MIERIKNMDDRLIKPTFQTRPYKSREVVRIRDRYEQFLFIKHGARPVDMYVSPMEDLIMIFLKDETRELYKLYREYKLK